MEQKDYTKLAPLEPPTDIVSWLTNLGCFKNEYIVYKSEYVTDPLTGIKKKMVHCTCSACEREFYAHRSGAGGCHHSHPPAPFGFINPETSELVISSEETKCPYCGTDAKAIHVGNIGGTEVIGSAFPMTIERIQDRIALIGWRIVRVLYKDGHTSFEKYPYEAYVAEDRKIVCLRGYVKNFTAMTFTGKWHQIKRFCDDWGKEPQQLIYPWNPYILIGTSLENSKLDKYIKCGTEVGPVTYCNLFLKHKNVENLLMQGAGTLVNEKILGLTSYGYNAGLRSIKDINGINWKETKPHKMLGLTKDEFKLAKKLKWDFKDLDFYKQARNIGIKPENVSACRKHGYYDILRLAENFPSENVLKAMRYIDKQNRKYKRRRDIGYLMDYWNMLAPCGENFNDPEVCYPQNLTRAHDALVERMEYKEQEELKVKFAQRYDELSEYNYLADGMFISPAATEAELIAEGKKLHHCVGGYAKRHANGKTAIFFIRHVSEPEVSYFTLELDENTLTVRQNRGLRNCARTEEVEIFEKKWLEYIRKISITEKETKKNGRNDKKAA